MIRNFPFVLGATLAATLLISCSSGGEEMESDGGDLTAPEPTSTSPPTATPTPTITPTPTTTPQPTFAPTQSPGELFDFLSAYQDLDDRLNGGYLLVLFAPDQTTRSQLKGYFEQIQADLAAMDVPDTPEAEQLVEATVSLIEAYIRSTQNPNLLSSTTPYIDQYAAAHAAVVRQIELPPADTTVDLGSGQLLFTCNSEDLYGICVMNADRSGRRVITSSEESIYSPRWCPDGTQVAFTSFRNDVGDVYVINTDGSGETNLTNGQGGIDPDWSPDGTQIVFASSRDIGEDYQLYVMNADGTGVARLTNEEGSCRYPVWSPDGRKIAFTITTGGLVEGEADIYVMNSDGSGVTQLTDSSEIGETTLRWSPDGNQIAFVGRIVFEGRELYVMNADGSEITQLTDDDYFEEGAAWSPDGTWLLFSSDPVFNTEIYMMALSHGGVAPLTSTITEDEVISDWLP